MMFGRKKRKDETETKVNCFKCGEELSVHTLYCTRCKRQQFLSMEGLERAFDDDLPGSIRIQEEELKEDPNNYYRHFALGNSLFLNGDYPGAIHRYKMSLDLKPDFGDAKLNLGNVHKLTGNNSAAEEMLEAFKRESPHSNKVESAHKLLCEIRGIPWEPKKNKPGKIPEIIQPGLGREKVELRREGLNFPTLVFAVLIVLCLIFGIVRRDIVTSAWDHIVGTLGGYLSVDVDSRDMDSSDGDEGNSVDEGGSGFLARLFGRRDAEEVLEDDDWTANPTGNLTPGEPETPDEVPDDGPINLDPVNDSYWPMEQGNNWKYRGWDVDSHGRRVEGSMVVGTIRVLLVEKDGEPTVYKLSRFGKTPYYFETEDGIWETNHPDRPFSSGVEVIHKPVEIGYENIDAGRGMGLAVMEEVDLETVAGTIRTIKIRTWLTDFPRTYTEIYYGKGVGPVRLKYGSDRTGFRIWELTAFEVSEDG